MQCIFADDADIFVVITKYDHVTDQIPLDKNTYCQIGSISMEEFKTFEKKISAVFSIEGAQENNMINWASYTGGRDIDNPYIDNIALKFLKVSKILILITYKY